MTASPESFTLGRTLPATGRTPPLHWRFWPADGGGATTSPRASLLLVHGYLDHGGRYAHLAERLAKKGISCGAIDLRGQGLSAGRRAYIEHFADYVADATYGLAQLPADVPRFVLGHSNGGLVALEMAQDPSLGLRGLLLSNPFLAQTTPAPVPKRLVGHLAGHLWPSLSLPAGIAAADLTHDAVMQRAHADDPLVQHRATAGWYREVTRVQRRLVGLRRLELPLLYLYSDADPVADPAHNAQLAQQIVSPDKEIHCRPGERHEIFHEVERLDACDRLAAWMVQRLA